MRISIFLVTAQWALLFALGLLVILMFRQLARQLNPASRSGTDLGPDPGSRPARFEYTRVSDGTTQRFSPGDGKPALLAFADVMCPSCEELVTSLGEADARDELAGAKTLLLISDPPSYLQVSKPFRTTRLEIGRIIARSALEAYRVSATPLLVAIDHTGIVRRAGPAVRPADVRGYVHALHVPASPVGATLDVLPTNSNMHTKPSQ